MSIFLVLIALVAAALFLYLPFIPNDATNFNGSGMSKKEFCEYRYASSGHCNRHPWID